VSEERGRDLRGRDDRWDRAIGERERRGSGLGWLEVVWAGWLPGCGPGGLLASYFYLFFFCFPFLFVLISVLSFFERVLLFRFE
jgi:hypothetical protein